MAIEVKDPRRFQRKGVKAAPFSEAEFLATEHRVRTGQDLTAAPIRPTFDAKQWEEHRANHLQKRAIEDYQTVLVSHGFSFLSDLELVKRGRNPTGSGLWVSLALREAFSCDDVLSMFPTPEEFHKWITTKATAAKLTEAVCRKELTATQRRNLLKR